jgi:hypothetical protein
MGKKSAAATIEDQLRAALRERVEAGASVLALAQAAGVAQPRLRAFLRGEGDLRLRTAAKLCAHLGLQLREGRPGRMKALRSIPD